MEVERPAKPWGGLSKSEQEILDLLCCNLSYKQIATRRVVRETTVITMVNRIKTVLDLPYRASDADLIRFAKEAGIVGGDAEER